MQLNTNSKDRWSNLARVVYARTYSRLAANNEKETWYDTVTRVVNGNAAIAPNVMEPGEREKLFNAIYNRKIFPGGRGLWMSGVEVPRIKGTAQVNCWFWTAEKPEHFVYAMDYLMTGGGVGMSVEHRFVSKLPRVKKVDFITHINSSGADFIVPDTREGWCTLLRKVLESFFYTGESFTYSTCVVRGAGAPIRGFGGTASGPYPLIECVTKLFKLLSSRVGRFVRPIDAGDIITSIGEMVVAGNVRRSAIILLGDPWDREYLAAKRWDLGVPNNRAFANYSVVASDFEDLHPDFWKTYERGEPFGIVNRRNIQTYGRMGEERADFALGVNPCGEIGLENGEPCNIGDVHLQNIGSEEEFIENAILLYRYCKRVTLLDYHNPVSAAVIARNRRVGVGLTGCLMSPLFAPATLDKVYKALRAADEDYSHYLGVPKSVRLTTIKPAGTVSKVGDAMGYEGIHPAFSRYMIQRVRFAASDPLVERLREAGHHIEPVERFDGTLDHNTQVVDFYQKAPDGYPVADEDWDTWKQLEVLKMVQKHWSDNSVSVTVYYKPEDLPRLKEWVRENLPSIKTVSFLCATEHGFKQAPKEAISKEDYEKLSAKIRPVDLTANADGDMLEGVECEGGSCPIR